MARPLSGQLSKHPQSRGPAGGEGRTPLPSDSSPTARPGRARRGHARGTASAQLPPGSAQRNEGRTRGPISSHHQGCVRAGPSTNQPAPIARPPPALRQWRLRPSRPPAAPTPPQVGPAGRAGPGAAGGRGRGRYLVIEGQERVLGRARAGPRRRHRHPHVTTPSPHVTATQKQTPPPTARGRVKSARGPGGRGFDVREPAPPPACPGGGGAAAQARPAPPGGLSGAPRAGGYGGSGGGAGWPARGSAPAAAALELGIGR